MLPVSHPSPPFIGSRSLVRAEARWAPWFGRSCFSCTINRGGSIADLEKRPRGRPRTGEAPTKGVRIPLELEAKIIAWIERQPDPKPSRSEAIRRLIEMGLGQ